MSITLDQVTKQYQGNPVVNDVSLKIGDGEFFVLLGPSGSGKSTLLRAIAGLTAVDHGRITLKGRDVTDVSARERGTGFVFQNYALFRHMTVAENIEFALRVRRVPKAERVQRRKELLELVALPGMDDRLPTQLSGGQQQRVAVARALAHKPEVLLLDEPFGALDAKIREGLRRTIRTVQRELGITTILVTHDQEEAFAMADRIGVMNLGRLLEVGRPADLYSRPATRFVATFLGAANLLLRRQPVEVQGRGPRFRTRGRGREDHREAGREHAREHEVVAVLRPEEVELTPAADRGSAAWLGEGTVEELVFTGALERLRVRMLVEGPQPPIPGCADCTTSVVLEVTRTQAEQRAFPLAVGQPVSISARRIHVLPTPISSFTAVGPDEASVAALARHAWLTDLAARMQTRIAGRVTSNAATLDSLLGVSVVATGPGCPEQVRQLLDQGATEILCLPLAAEAPNRVLIHCAAPEARRATLAVAASLLRHVPAEATFLGILPPGVSDTTRRAGMRELLDVRSEAQLAHGMDVRTEVRVGDEVPELVRSLEAEDSSMLILGLAGDGRLSPELKALLARPAGWPVLLV